MSELTLIRDSLGSLQRSLDDAVKGIIPRAGPLETQPGG